MRSRVGPSTPRPYSAAPPLEMTARSGALSCPCRQGHGGKQPARVRKHHLEREEKREGEEEERRRGGGEGRKKGRRRKGRGQWQGWVGIVVMGGGDKWKKKN